MFDLLSLNLWRGQSTALQNSLDPFERGRRKALAEIEEASRERERRRRRVEDAQIAALQGVAEGRFTGRCKHCRRGQ